HTSLHPSSFFLPLPRAPRSTLSPYTTLFRSEGFDVELLYSVPKSQGSWVAMAFDPLGRLIVSDQDDKGVFRVTLGDAKPTAENRSEEHTSELQSRENLVCRLLLEKKKRQILT